MVEPSASIITVPPMIPGLPLNWRNTAKNTNKNYIDQALAVTSQLTETGGRIVISPPPGHNAISRVVFSETQVLISRPNP